MPAQAQEAGSGTLVEGVRSDGADSYTDEIVVTGQAMPDAVLGIIPPENQIAKEEIASYGVDSISDLLAEIADQTESIAGRDFTDGPVVLVNGRRISGIDEVGDLPAEAVLRVDILPEDVALRYGYDAQSKVVNIILKRRFGSQIGQGTGGMAAEGGGGQAAASLVRTRIRSGDRLNLTARIAGEAAILESERDIIADPARGPGAAAGTAAELSDDTAWRTLRPSTRTYTLGASLAHDLGSRASTSFELKGNYRTSDGLDGLASGTLRDPAAGPYGKGAPVTVSRYLSERGLRRATHAGGVSAGGTLNVDFSTRWKLSVVGNYAHSESRNRWDARYDTSFVQAALDAGDPAVDPYGTLPEGLLGDPLRYRNTARSDTGSASALLTGKLARLPAGDLGASLRIGGDRAGQASSAERGGVVTRGQVGRTNGSARLSIDVPLTSPSRGVLGVIGTLGFNAHVGAARVSDFGTLTNTGFGVSWIPLTGISLLASFNRDRGAPTIAELGNPVTVNANRRVFDYVTGTSALVSRVTGGNPGLRADDRRTFRLGLNARLTVEPRLSFTASYTDSRNHDGTMALGGVTDAVERAFPDRIVRGADGMLTSVDARSVNIYRERREQIRWGITLSAQLRKSERAERLQARRQGGDADRHDDAEQTEAEGWSDRSEQDAPDRGDIAAREEARAAAELRDDMAPDDTGSPGRERRAAVGRALGKGSGRGAVRGSRNGGGGGRDDGARLLFSLHHTLILRQELQLAEGGDTIDLLHGGTLSGASTPRYKVTGSLGLTDNGLGLRLEGNWRSASEVSGAGRDLRFGALSTLDLRFFANLENRLGRGGWARGTRISLSIANLFDSRQRVTGPDGVTPYAYQKDYLDPMGRTLLLSLRRSF